MPPPSDELIRDSASLRRLIRSVHLPRDENDRTHREATTKFLGYISDLGIKTEAYLQKLASTPPDPDPRMAAIDRENLTILRNFWFNLHEFAQPSRNADTLHSPVVLVAQLEEQLSKIPELRGCELLISHTTELNYIQYPRQELRERGDEYAGIVPGAPHFPRKLALIAMPYSQDEALFSNLLICHEMGHFAFEELELEADLSRCIRRALKKHVGHRSVSDLSWCYQRLWYWAEELFCDRFAIGLLGPSFSFSYIELFDVIGMDDDQVNEFSDTHPSDSCRFYEHYEQLNRGAWWSLLDRAGGTYPSLIRKLRGIPRQKYTFTSKEQPVLGRLVMKAFRDVQPYVGTLVTRTLKGHEARFQGGGHFECVEAIQKYLGWGIVPATLIRDGKAFYPDPVLLINAAYLFYLDGVPKLIERIKMSRQERSNYVSQREKWGQRVEQWTLKALEDLRLPNRRELWKP